MKDGNLIWPRIGSKAKFKGVHYFWFTNIIKDAETFLEIDKEYTIIKLQLASSWCGVVLEEFPEKTFALSFFEHENALTTDEVRAIEKLQYKKIKANE